MKYVPIGSRRVGDGEPCYVIAEAGSNHCGSLDQARQLIDVAAASGADAVKFQVFRASRLYPKTAGVSGYLKDPTPIFDVIAAMEIPYNWIPKLADHCIRRGVDFLASAFDEESTDQIAPYVPVFKIASYEMTHAPLVRHTAHFGKPVIVSTGTADLAEVAATVRLFGEPLTAGLVLMQCTAAYPAPLDSMNVRAIVTMRERFGIPVGLSDHSADPVIAPVAAVACGAAVIEKHFTLSHALPGPDHRFALEPDQLLRMVSAIRDAERALGTGEKTVAPIEQELRAFARRSLFAVRDIATGELLTDENVAVLRNGQHAAGLPPDQLGSVLGRPAARAIPADSLLAREDVGKAGDC